MLKLKQFAKGRKLQIILTIVSLLLVFLLTLYIYFHSTLIYANCKVLIIFVLCYLLPLIINLSILLLDYKRIITKKRSRILSLIFIPFIVIYLFIVTFIMGIIELEIPVTDYNYYKKILNYKHEYKLVKKFPKDISNVSENLLFHYHLGMSNYPCVLNIYYKTDDKTVKKYIRKYSKETVRIEYIDEQTKDNVNYKIYIDGVSINDDYIIYYLTDDYNKNSYIAINEKDNECILVFNYY